MFDLIFKRTALKRTIFFVLADCTSIAVSLWLSFLIRFDGKIPAEYSGFIIKMVFLAAVFIIPIFHFSKLYSFSWSFVSASEAISLFKATTISFLFLGIAIYFSKYFPNFKNFPRSTIFISYFLVFVLCGFSRFAKRIYFNIASDRPLKKEKTLIVGAGDAGEQILRSIASFKETSYNLFGFVDDNPIKQGVIIHGLKVFGKIKDIPQIVKKYDIKRIIVALPAAGNATIKNVIDISRKSGIRKIKIVPHIKEIMMGDVSFRNLRDVDVDNLLGREKLDIALNQIESFVKNKKVMITGAAGSIGSELCRQSARFNPSLILMLDQDETGIFNISKEISEKFPSVKIRGIIADVADEAKINRIFKKFLPDIVFHAAAYKHVPLMEEFPDEALKNNIFGTENVAKAALENSAEKFIFISTDKAVNPTSIMGLTKRVGEMICCSLSKSGKTKFISVRFGNVLDSRGSVIPIFRDQIKRGGPVEVTHPEMKRYFMLISEACLLVMQAGCMGQGGEVFVLDMGKPVKIIDLAKEMIRMSGFEPDKDIAIVFTGIRPGEKLFEEILTAEEGTVATRSHKIFISKLRDFDVEKFKEKINMLRQSAKERDEAFAILKQIVPNYCPKEKTNLP